MSPEHAGLHIRQAVPDDAAAIVGIRVAAWRAGYQGLMPPAYLAALDPTMGIEPLRERLLQPPAGFRVLLAELGGRVLGQATLGLPRHPAAAALELWALNVHPSAWGKGLAQALLLAVADEARRHGVSRLCLWCMAANLRARHCYERAGWQPGGQQRCNDWLTGTPLAELDYLLKLPLQAEAAPVPVSQPMG